MSDESNIIEKESVNSTIKCSLCGTELAEIEIFCSNCGYPEKGTDSDKKKFNANQQINEIDYNEAKRKINNAKYILFVIGGLNLILGFVLGFKMENSNAVIIESVIIAVIYVGLGFWCNSKPLPAIIAGLILYLTLIILNMIIDPITIIQGIIWKIVIIGAFIKGISAAREAQELLKKINLSSGNN
jgi:hypothetical protein